MDKAATIPSARFVFMTYGSSADRNTHDFGEKTEWKEKRNQEIDSRRGEAETLCEPLAFEEAGV
jgi:hypothetical protein